MPKKLALIIPCYNEEQILNSTFGQLKELLTNLINKNLISDKSILCFVNDGSIDKTWGTINHFSQTEKLCCGIKLSRNFGHQYALLAGLETLYNCYDIYISIDADLQDDISVIENMVIENEKGASIVYGVRKERKTDSLFKRKSAEYFYKLMKIFGVRAVYNHADFRLIDNNVLKELLRFKEINLFLRGIFPLIGFNQSTVYYNRKEREDGETKYPLRKMVSFAWEGITSFSTTPMRIILYMGLVSFFVSIGFATWAVVFYIKGRTIPGWMSIITPVIFFGCLQMISLGIVGEYIGKIYKEIKGRPRYILEEFVKNELD